MLLTSTNRPNKMAAKLKRGNQCGTGMRTAQSSRGLLPTSSKCSKCNSNNSVTSAPLEGVDSVMEDAAITAVATAVWDSKITKAATAKITEPIKQEERVIPNNTKIKDSHGKEAIAKCSRNYSSTIRDMGM